MCLTSSMSRAQGRSSKREITPRNEAKIIQVQCRAPEDRDFEDEVEYPATIKLSERFQKYRGMKSFRSSIWSRFVNDLNSRKALVQTLTRSMCSRIQQ